MMPMRNTEMSEIEKNKLIPITQFSDKLPCKTALNRCSKEVTMLADLYRAIGEKTSFTRYGNCWNYFPSDLKEEDLSGIISILRRHITVTKDKVSFTLKSDNSEFIYEDITKAQIKKMCHCAYALKQDLQMLKWNGDNQRVGENGY